MVGKRRVVYSPPPRAVFDEYAERVCTRLAEQYGTSIYTSHEVVWGLARFLQLSADILAKHLNTEYEKSEESLDSSPQ